MKKIFVILIPFTVIFTSCKDFLSIDKYFSDEIKLDSVFTEKRYVEAYLWATPMFFDDEGSLLQNTGTPGPLATDEAFTAMGVQHGYNGVAFAMDQVSARWLAAPGAVNERLNIWPNMYVVIRRCNTILQRIDEAGDMTTVEKFKITGNARFMRAYAYYKLLLNMGPPILVGDELVANNESLDFYDRGRCTYDEAVEYICSELEEAAKYLDPKTSIMDFGRPTRGAAYGLIARLRLYHASPLHNGGDIARQVYGTWRRKTDDVQYVSQTYDERRWALAAAAAKRVIDLNQYSLHTVISDNSTKGMPVNITSDADYYDPWPNGAAGIDHFKSYSDMFTGEAVAATNPEFVWGCNSSTLTGDTRMAFPNTNGGWNGMAVPQKIIDAYSMFDGRAIDDYSPDYPYSETGFSPAQEMFSEYQLNANVYNMYVNREMRFYASIGFTNGFWPLESCTSSKTTTISYLFDGNNGKNTSSDPLNHTPTGYVIKKFIHRQDAWNGDNARRMPKAYAIIRYADILLMYAEALNNLTQSHTVEVDDVAQTYSRDRAEIGKAFNQVRHRAGLPGLTDSELAGVATVQQLIEKERMVEFLFENSRYFDVRRWGKYEESESQSIRGMNIEGNADSYYRRVVPNSSLIGARVVHRKLHLVPLPLDEVRRLPSLDQNPGWEN
ncbi:MAG: RagB/SusD family nutrient uptake outer membrane protein [Bacteroidales bacterium]|jgi:hypothetical protein|nr:RagB/SusD family nutrient uptake outer membrane protein [Bacteroidales bacterium]